MQPYSAGCRLLLATVSLGAFSLTTNSAALAQTTATAPATTSLRVEGLVPTPRTLATADLAALKHITLKAKDKEGKQHTYAGVPLAEVLHLAGAPTGKDIHGKVLSQALLVSAADGYQAVFALPELDPAFTSQTILLADQRDGQPLPAGLGPYQIIVPQEKRPTRWVRQVTTLQVVQVKP